MKYEHAITTLCKCRYEPRESQMNWDDEDNGMNKELHFQRGHTKTTMTTSSAYSDLLELGNTLQGLSCS